MPSFAMKNVLRGEMKMAEGEVDVRAVYRAR